MSATPALAHLLYAGNFRSRSPVMLFDVGCSGGVEPHWFHFGEALHAVGFDPLVAEVDRLNAETPRHGAIRYEAAYIGYSKYDELFPEALRNNEITNKSNTSFERTSAAEYARLTSLDYIKETFNRGKELVFSDQHYDLDQYVASKNIQRVDILKIDTDGHDIEVLLGAQNLLKSSCLAVCIEAQFHGATNRYANTFNNIDTLLRDLGFTLFDLEPLRYTRAALPGRFCHDMAAQTVGGAIQWAEAIYARDLADPNYERKHSFSATLDDILKLAAFFDIFGLQDCAAELLLSRPDQLAGTPALKLDTLLNTLTPDVLGNEMSFDAYISTFRRDPSVLFPSKLDRRSREAAIAAEFGDHGATLAQALDRLAQAERAAEIARAELNAIRTSTSWRATAPLRRLMDIGRR